MPTLTFKDNSFRSFAQCGLKNDFKDYEDSIQYSSALNVKGIEAIITRNTKDYVKAELPIFTSESYIKMINER